MLVRRLTALVLAVAGVVAPAVAASADGGADVADLVVLRADGDGLSVEVVPVRTAAQAASLTTELGRDPAVLAVEPRVEWAPMSDPSRLDQTYLDTANVPVAWQTTNGAGQVVAVLDTGIVDIPDLAGQVADRENFAPGTDPGTHGTGVASIIAALRDNGAGISGAAPAARLLDGRVCDTTCPSDAIARGLLWAADSDADVINVSLGGTSYSAVVHEAIRYAVSRGSVVVVAAGNAGASGNPRTYPASLPEVIAVSGLGAQSVGGRWWPTDAPATFSTTGFFVDVAAPGEAVTALRPPAACGGQPQCAVPVSGTSFAAPQVAAIAALVRAANPALTPSQVQAVLMASARDAGPSGRDDGRGAGIVDAAAAVAVAAGLPGPVSVEVTSTPTGPSLSWAAVAGTTGYRVYRDGRLDRTVAGGPVVFTELPPGVQAALEVSAVTGAGESARSMPVLSEGAQPALAAPTLLAATPSGGTVTLSWTAVSGADAYAVLRNGMVATRTSGTSAVVEAPAGGRYTFTVSAHNGADRASIASNELVVVTGSGLPPLPAPTGLLATTGPRQGSVHLRWQPVAGAVGYTILRNGAVAGTARTTGVVLTVPGGPATWAVRAVDAALGESPPSAVVSFPAGSPPGAPVAVSAVAGDGRATVSFSAGPPGDGPITGFVVQASPGGMIATGTGSPIVVTGLTNGVVYTFTVRATNLHGTGPVSLASSPVVPMAAVTGSGLSGASAVPRQGVIGPSGPVTVVDGRVQPIPVTLPPGAIPVAVAQTASRAGAWVADSAGRLTVTGDAPHLGDLGHLRLNRPVNGFTPTPSGRGYWMVASDGGVFAFGDAGFYGSTGSIRLNKPIVGMAPSPTSRGYWLVASDGGIFAFGDAGFYGSTGSIPLNRPINGMAATPSGRGYWLVASDGGIFAFGDARFFGSLGGQAIGTTVTGMISSPTGNGYWLLTADGRVFAFGDART